MAQQATAQQLSLLRDLVHIDLDAISLYDSVLRTLTAPQLEQAMMEFRSDHLRHVQELNDLLAAFGGQREPARPSIESCQRHGFSLVREGMSVEELLTVAVDGEQITNQTYERVLKEDWPPVARALIDRNFADEQRHLLWVLTAARTRLWEQEAPTPSVP